MEALKSIAKGWTPDRLARIQAALADQNLSGWILPRWDRHHFEYVAPCDELLGWATGFSGSWGLAIVMVDRSALFVDGRYTEQAAREVSDTAFTRHHLFDDPPEKWISDHPEPGLRLGYDPEVMTPALLKTLEKAATQSGTELIACDNHPVIAAWSDRPPKPMGLAQVYGTDKTGQSSADKRAALAQILETLDVDLLPVSTPDNIAWLFNLRGDDLEFIPAVQARALIHRDGRADLFIDPAKLDDTAEYEFAAPQSGVTLHGDQAFLDQAKACLKPGQSLFMDTDFSSAGLIQIAHSIGAKVKTGTDPLTRLKAVKSETELAAMRHVAQRDSAIWCAFLHWLEETVPARDQAGNPVTELEAENALEALRRNDPHYTAPSFRTIPAADANGALAHYAAPAEGGAPLTRDSVFLIDAGGQYADGGTTDTTRTLVFSDQPDDIGLSYTLVLKGHIALSRLVFPEGTCGHQIDAFARAALWQYGRDYDHGTGHGVGSYLSVHEFPQRLRKSASPEAFHAGMTLTNEPGYYEAGRFGIRIENLCELKTVQPGFLGLEEMALIPIQTRLIQIDLLTEAELDWLNAYHQRVRDEIGPLITDAPVRAWLDLATQPLHR